MAQVVGVEMSESATLEYWDAYVQSVRVYWREPTEHNKRAAETWYGLFQNSYLSESQLEMTVH